MGGGRGRSAVAALVVLACQFLLGLSAQGQSRDELNSLRSQIEQLRAEGKFREAVPVAERFVALARQLFREDQPKLGAALSWLAGGYTDVGRYTEAEQVYLESLAITEKASGNTVALAREVNELGVFYDNQGRYAQAEPLYLQALTIAETILGPEHPDLYMYLRNLAGMYEAQSRFSDAERYYKRELAIREKIWGPDDYGFGTLLADLGFKYEMQGRDEEAERLFQRAIAILQKYPNASPFEAYCRDVQPLYDKGKYGEAIELGERCMVLRRLNYGKDDARFAHALGRQGQDYFTLGRFAQAEPLLKRELTILEKAAPTHEVVSSLHGLGNLYGMQGRYGEAEPLLLRALAIEEQIANSGNLSLFNLGALYINQGRYAEAEALYRRLLESWRGPDKEPFGITLGNLGHVLEGQGRLAEAEPFYARSLALYEREYEPNHRYLALPLDRLAKARLALGRYDEAGPLLERALRILEASFGPDHPDLGAPLRSLGWLYQLQGRLAEAQPLYQRSLSIREQMLGPDHPDVSSALDDVAALAFAQGDWPAAVAYWKRSTGILVRRAQRAVLEVWQPSDDKRKHETQRERNRFAGLVKAAHRMASQGHDPDASLLHDTFETAQWMRGSEAAVSLLQMTARGAKGDASLAALVRERQDLAEEWQKRHDMRNAALSTEPGRRNRAAETINITRLTAIDARIAEIDKRLVAHFPDYAALIGAAPLSVADVQERLGDREALVLFLDTAERAPAPEETFIWVVTKARVRWVRTGLGTTALQHEVAALRCGLDTSLWDDAAGAARCGNLLKRAPRSDTSGSILAETLPFDNARAHALYKALFGQVEDLIRGKHLMIVPSGPLTQLPFHVLVTKHTPSRANVGLPARNTAWMVREHAITVLPAVSSLKALRSVAKASAGPKPMLGIGNPLLDGNLAKQPWEAGWAKLARDKQACRPPIVSQRQRTARPVRSVGEVASHGGRPDLMHLRSQMPLPETADELCAVARDFRVAPDDVLLGARASETMLKSLALADYRIIHFATHGAIAGEIVGTNEPGLILTPPGEQTELDDGYLSASEVAALKLDADWVILSACNTAAGGSEGAEALSGLARAFIYAGARALLVSHWSVDSATTVKLITSATGSIAHDAKLSRSEALRRGMLALIDKGKWHEAHPAFWAPFIVVGGGAS